MAKHWTKRKVFRSRFGRAPDRMTMAELACYTGASRRTIKRWVAQWDQDGSPVAERDEGRWLVVRDEFLRWLDSRRGEE